MQLEMIRERFFAGEMDIYTAITEIVGRLDYNALVSELALLWHCEYLGISSDNLVREHNFTFNEDAKWYVEAYFGVQTNPGPRIALSQLLSVSYLHGVLEGAEAYKESLPDSQEEPEGCDPQRILSDLAECFTRAVQNPDPPDYLSTYFDSLKLRGPLRYFLFDLFDRYRAKPVPYYVEGFNND